MAHVAGAHGEALLHAIMDLHTIDGPKAPIQEDDVDWALLERVSRVCASEELEAWGRLFAIAYVEEDPQFLTAIQILLRRRLAN